MTLLGSDESIGTMRFGAMKGGVSGVDGSSGGSLGNRFPVGFAVGEVAKTEDNVVGVGVAGMSVKNGIWRC